MFEVRHEDDAWELGVLKACGFFDSPDGSSKSPKDLGVPARLVEFFDAGSLDQRAVSDERISKFACQWGVA